VQTHHLIPTNSAPVCRCNLILPSLIPSIKFFTFNVLTKIVRDPVEYILKDYSSLVGYKHWPWKLRGGVICHVFYVHVRNHGICSHLGAVSLGKRNSDIWTGLGIDDA